MWCSPEWKWLGDLNGGESGEDGRLCLTPWWTPSTPSPENTGSTSTASFLIRTGSEPTVELGNKLNSLSEEAGRRMATLLLSSSVSTQEVFIPADLHFLWNYRDEICRRNNFKNTSNLQNWHLFRVCLSILHLRSFEHSKIGRLLFTVLLLKWQKKLEKMWGGFFSFDVGRDVFRVSKNFKENKCY